ncbi:MAG: hypothetical protein FWG91_02830 [Lachnospiraceae bacterium]|nr:hypothetical protein [Lachnospiraceae bacterium]
MFKKKFCLVLGMILLLGFSNNCNALKPEPNSLPDYEFYVDNEIHKSINEFAEDDLSFAKQRELLIFYNEIIDEINEEYFGGAYFDENENLVILIKEGALINSERINKEYVSFKIVKYSYEELSIYQKTINGLKEQIGFQATGINQQENKVNIYTDGKLNKEILYKTVPEDALNIIIGDYYGADSAAYTVVPGTLITNTFNGE